MLFCYLIASQQVYSSHSLSPALHSTTLVMTPRCVCLLYVPMFVCVNTVCVVCESLCVCVCVCVCVCKQCWWCFFVVCVSLCVCVCVCVCSHLQLRTSPTCLRSRERSVCSRRWTTSAKSSRRRWIRGGRHHGHCCTRTR